MPSRHDPADAPVPALSDLAGADRAAATEPADRVLLHLMLCAGGATLLLALATVLGH